MAQLKKTRSWRGREKSEKKKNIKTPWKERIAAGEIFRIEGEGGKKSGELRSGKLEEQEFEKGPILEDPRHRAGGEESA